MKTNDPCDDVVILRPHSGAGWSVELQQADTEGRKFAAVVGDKNQALRLAAEMCPGIPVRVVAGDS